MLTKIPNKCFLKVWWPQIKPIFIKPDYSITTSMQVHTSNIYCSVFMIPLITIYIILEIVFLKIEYLSARAIHLVIYIKLSKILTAPFFCTYKTIEITSLNRWSLVRPLPLNPKCFSEKYDFKSLLCFRLNSLTLPLCYLWDCFSNKYVTLIIKLSFLTITSKIYILL